MRRFYKGIVAQITHGLSQLILRIHHKRAVPGHGCVDRCARYQQKSEAFFAGLNRDFISGSKPD